MKLNRVLVICKHIDVPRNAVRSVPSIWVERRDEHQWAIKQVERILKKMGISFHSIMRRDVRKHEGVDLIVTVGGDGTVLAAAHHAGNVPILGVNSLPKTSVGFFCAATAATFEKRMRQILKGEKIVALLPMLQGRIDGEPLEIEALNDILFASDSPADSVYYRLRAGGKSEFQRGSGVWITAGPGSTAGFASAGGEPTEITSDQLRFLVREPCPLPSHRYKLLKGVLEPRQTLALVNEGKNGFLYVDGRALVVRLKSKQRLTISIARRKLKLFLKKG